MQPSALTQPGAVGAIRGAVLFFLRIEELQKDTDFL